MAHNQLRVYSHAFLVRALYKKAMRVCESQCNGNRLQVRYRLTKLRKEFDDRKNMNDQREIKALMAETDAKLEVLRDKKFQFPNCPGGLAEDREPYWPDWILDMWHPIDKAEFPGYFARREVAKRDHIEWWKKTYGASH